MNATRAPLRRLDEAWTGADGVLATDLHLPDSARWPVPTLLIRTPYDRTAFHERGGWWARRGVACAVQDVAGRHGSAGTWRPYVGEEANGAAAVDGVLAGEWSDGTIVASGASYAAFCAWSMALARPREVAGVISEVPALGPPHTTREGGGAARLGDHAAWWLAHGEGRVSRPDAHVYEAIAATGRDPLLQAPASELPRRLGIARPGFAEALRAPSGGLDLERLATLAMPTLHVAGWHDLFLREAFGLWRAAGRALAPRPSGELVVGAWGHGLDGSARHLRAARWLRDRLALAVAVDADAEPAPATSPTGLVRRWQPVGDARWRTRDGGSSAPRRRWWLDSAHGLRAESVGPTDPLVLVHDPAHPVGSVAPGADRRRLVGPVGAWRRWTTPRLRGPVELDGEAMLELRAVAAPAGVDLIATLESVDPAGAVRALARSTATLGATVGAVRFAFPHAAALVAAGGALAVTLATSDHPDLLLPSLTDASRLDARERHPGEVTLDPAPDGGLGTLELAIDELASPSTAGVRT